MKFELIWSGLNQSKKALNTVSQITKNTKQFNEQMKKAHTSVTQVDKALRKTDKTTKLLADQHKILTKHTNKAGDSIKSMTGTQGIFDMIDSGKQLQSIFGKGFAGMAKAALSFGSSLYLSLAPVLPIIAAIGAITYTLKKMWEANIGGMQTKFFKAFGKMKVLIAKFEVGFIKTLKVLAPIFGKVFGVMYRVIEPIFYIVGKLTSALFSLSKPTLILISVFGGLALAFKLLSSSPFILVIGGLLYLFSLLSKKMRIATAVIIGLGAAFLFASANPFIAIIGGIVIGIMLVVKGVSMLIKKFGGLKAIGSSVGKSLMTAFSPIKVFIDGLVAGFAAIKNGFMSVITSIVGGMTALVNKIPGPIKSLFGFGDKKEIAQAPKKSPAAESKNISNNNSNVINNNQNVNVTTSREIRSDTAVPFSQMIAQHLGGGY